MATHVTRAPSSGDHLQVDGPRRPHGSMSQIGIEINKSPNSALASISLKHDLSFEIKSSSELNKSANHVSEDHQHQQKWKVCIICQNFAFEHPQACLSFVCWSSKTQFGANSGSILCHLLQWRNTQKITKVFTKGTQDTKPSYCISAWMCWGLSSKLTVRGIRNHYRSYRRPLQIQQGSGTDYQYFSHFLMLIILIQYFVAVWSWFNNMYHYVPLPCWLWSWFNILAISPCRQWLVVNWSLNVEQLMDTPLNGRWTSQTSWLWAPMCLSWDVHRSPTHFRMVNIHS